MSIPKPPTFETKEQEREYLTVRFAAAFRILSYRGYNDNESGIMTLRDPVQPDTFWVNPAATHWSLLQSRDLLRVDQHGTPLPDQSGALQLFNKDAFLVHAAIFAERGDVVCIAQGRPPHGTAFSHFGKELDPITQDSCAFYNDNAVYNGKILGEEGGRRIATALGGRKALFLKNNGYLIAGPSIEFSVFFFTSCEKCCQVQMLAEAAAVGRQLPPPHKLDHEDAHNTWRVVGSVIGGYIGLLPEYHALEVREKQTRVAA